MVSVQPRVAAWLRPKLKSCTAAVSPHTTGMRSAGLNMFTSLSENRSEGEGVLLLGPAERETKALVCQLPERNCGGALFKLGSRTVFRVLVMNASSHRP